MQSYCIASFLKNTMWREPICPPPPPRNRESLQRPLLLDFTIEWNDIFFVCKLKYFSYPVQSFGALSAISATFSSLFREVRFRKAPRGAIDVIQFKHFHKTHYKELGKKLWNLHFFIFKGFTHAHAIIFQTKSITIILHFNCTNKCVNMRKSK